MAHLKKEDTGMLGILQVSSGNGDDPLKALLSYTIRQVLEEELTSFLNGGAVYSDRGASRLP